MMVRFIAVVMVAGIVSLLAACERGIGEYPRRQPPEGLLGDSAVIAQGRELFRGNCARCHGRPGEGLMGRTESFYPPAMTFADARYASMDPAYLYWRIDMGKDAEPFRSRGSVMPAWGPYFSEEQIWSLVAYIRARAGG